MQYLRECAAADGVDRHQPAGFDNVALRLRGATAHPAVAFILAVIFSWEQFVFGIVMASREPARCRSRLQPDLGRPVALGAACGRRPCGDRARAACSQLFAQRQIRWRGMTAGP